MTHCKDLAEKIEPLAAGEIALDAGLRAHLDACPHCTAALALARQVNEWLTSDAPQAPRHFTANVLQRLPSRTPPMEEGEEALDTWFDTAALASLIPVVIGIWLLMDPAFLQGALRLLPGLGNILTGYVAISITAVVIAFLAWQVADEL